VTLALPVAIGLFATLIRVLASADLTNDHFMHLAWAQQILFGELPGRDFVDPGMPLAYVLSAGVQWLHPGPVSEMYFSALMLGVAAGVTCVVVQKLTRSWLIGVGASLIEIAFQPRFYSYPKILVPAVTVLLLMRYLDRRSTSRLVWLGAWTSAAILLRHDYAIYVCTGVAGALLVMHWREWRTLLRAGSTYAAAVTATLLPYLAYVQWSEGLVEHLRRGIEFGKADEHQRVFTLPGFTTLSGGWDRAHAVSFLFYAAHALVIVIIALMIANRRQPRERLAATAGIVGMLAAYLAVILRYPVDQRLPDMASVLALGGAAAAGALADVIRRTFRTRPWISGTLAATALVVLVASVSSVWILGQTAEMINKTGVSAGMRGLRETFQQRRAADAVWPWAGAWPNDFPDAVLYLNDCTTRNDALLLTWRAPEYNFFARRKFAAGHAEFLAPRAFTSPADQAQMLAWLAPERVPVVLINQAEAEEFSRTYPAIQSWLDEHYAAAGHYTNYDDAEIVVAVRKDLRASRTWGPDAWPCGFSSPG
jgi:hypothetical protein